MFRAVLFTIAPEENALLKCTELPRGCCAIQDKPGIKVCVLYDSVFKYDFLILSVSRQNHRNLRSMHEKYFISLKLKENLKSGRFSKDLS
jgi:hypothetical protein